MSRRGGSGAQASGDEEKSGRARTPQSSEGPRCGTRAQGFAPRANLTPRAGRRRDWAHDTARQAPQPQSAPRLWVGFIPSLNWREGRSGSLWRIVSPSSLVSGRLQRAHLESTAPPNAALPAGVTSGNGNSPPPAPAPAPAAFGFGVLRRASPPPAVDRPARRRRRGPAVGEAGRGAYLVHGERHADPVLLQQHGPAGRGPQGREAGRGASPDRCGCRPGAGQGSRAGRRSSRGAALSSWLPAVLPRACQGAGPGAWGSPLVPRRGRCSWNAVLQSQGARKEDGSARPPAQDMPGSRRGREEGVHELKQMHRSHLLDPPPKAGLNLATPLPPAGLPRANVTRNTLQPEPEMPTFQTKARSAPLPGRQTDFLLFLGPDPRAPRLGWERKGKSKRRRRRSALPDWGPGASSNLAGGCQGRREEAGAFRARPLPRVPRLRERRARPRVRSHLAGPGSHAELQ